MAQLGHGSNCWTLENHFGLSDDSASGSRAVSSGKLRVIDDAAAGGQSAHSSDCNKLDLCSAIQPTISCKVLFARAPELLHTSELETEGEDWRDAYRFVPI